MSDGYLRLRYSRGFLQIWKWIRRDAASKLAVQRDFYYGLLNEIKDRDEVIFDIGANEGFTTELFASVTSRTIAVEPSPLNAKILQARFKNVAGVSVLEAAVTESKGRAVLYMEKGTALHTLNSHWKQLLEKGNYRIKTDFVNKVTVDTVTLAELIDRFGCPAFIKIDTEGYEKNVISTLNVKTPQLLFEAVLPEFIEETEYCVRHLHELDNGAVFNYAVNDQLILAGFVKADVLLPLLSDVNASVDIICRMSNYRQYYK